MSVDPTIPNHDSSRDCLPTRDEVLARVKPFPPYEEMVIQELTDEEEQAFLDAIEHA
jgi:hypothetical protein